VDAATVSPSEYSIADATRTTDDGEVASIILATTVQWSYEVPEQPEVYRLRSQVGDGNGSWQTIADYVTSASETSNSGSKSVQGDVLSADYFTAADFGALENGTETSVTVPTRVQLVVTAADDRTLAQATATDSAVVTIKNDEYVATEHGEVGGSGGVTIGTPTPA
jgi:hypothetical protein